MIWFGWALLSALLSAAAAIIQKKALARATALEFSFLVSSLILGLSLFIPFSIDITDIPLVTLLILLGKSLVGGMAFLFVMIALERNQISSVLPLLGLTPAVTALLSFLLTGELLGRWEWVGIGLMVTGAYILESHAGEKESGFTPQAWSSRQGYIVAALFLFAISSIADKLLVTGYRTDPLIVLVYQHAVYCMLFGALLLKRKPSLRGIIPKGVALFPILGAVALLTLAYRFAQLEATKDAPVALVLAVKRTSILYASFFGGKLFADERLLAKLVGAFLIVGSGFVILRNVG